MTNVLLILSLILSIFSMPTFAAGISEKHIYSSFTEDFSPAKRSKTPSNIGQWSFNEIDRGSIDHNNGSGFVEKTDHPYTKYAVQLPVFTMWDGSHPSFGTHERSSSFTGDYIKNRVVSLSVDTRIIKDLTFKNERPITLVLRGKDGFTLYKTMYYCEPQGNSANCPNIPPLPTQWTTYTFTIPKTLAEAKQEGWRVYNLNDHDINYELQDHFKSILSDVQKVDFMYGAPRVVYGMQFYAIEATNVTITKASRHHDF